MNFIHSPSVFWYILVRLLMVLIASSCVFLLMLRSESVAALDENQQTIMEQGIWL